MALGYIEFHQLSSHPKLQTPQQIPKMLKDNLELFLIYQPYPDEDDKLTNDNNSNQALVHGHDT